MNIKKIGIYCFINTHNGKRYVGQSIDIDARHKGHLRELNNNTHYNVYLQSAFNKYGSSCFEFHILEECGADMLDMREIAWINYYHSFGEGGYNLTSGGCKGKEVSAETKRKISVASKGRVKSAEELRKLSVASNGRVKSAEELRKCREAQKRRPPASEETRRKMSESAKRKPPISEETRRKLGEASLARWSLKKSLTLQNN